MLNTSGSYRYVYVCTQMYVFCQRLVPEPHTCKVCALPLSYIPGLDVVETYW